MATLEPGDYMPRMFWKPADGQGPACLSIEFKGVKQYRKIWDPGGPEEFIEWGLGIAETAVEVRHVDS